MEVVAGALTDIGLHPELTSGIISPGLEHLEAIAVPDQVLAWNREGGLHSSGGQHLNPQGRHAGADLPYRRGSCPQGSGLDLQMLGHRHFGRAVHRATCYVPPFLDANEVLLGEVTDLYCPPKQRAPVLS